MKSYSCHNLDESHLNINISYQGEINSLLRLQLWLDQEPANWALQDQVSESLPVH